MPMNAATDMWSSSLPMLIIPPPTSTKNVLLVSTATTTPTPTHFTSQNEITNTPTRVARNETSYIPTPTPTQLITIPDETVNSSSRGPLWVWAVLLVTVTFIMSATGILIIIAAVKCRHRTGSYYLNDTARHPTEENQCDSETDTFKKKTYFGRLSSNRSSTSSSKRTGILSPRFGLGNRTRSSLSLNLVRGGILRGSRQSLSSLRSHRLVDMKLNLVYTPPVSCSMFKDPPLTQETAVDQDSIGVAMQDSSHSENQLEQPNQQEILESRSTLSGHDSEGGSSCSSSSSSDITLHMYPV